MIKKCLLSACQVLAKYLIAQLYRKQIGMSSCLTRSAIFLPMLIVDCCLLIGLTRHAGAGESGKCGALRAALMRIGRDTSISQGGKVVSGAVDRTFFAPTVH